jgi:two-component SAPR family response regulator
MVQSKKYDYQVSKDDAGWITQITRRVSSKKMLVTKSQGGFASEAEASAWGQDEVKTFLKNLNLNEQKKRRDKKNEQGE